MTESIVINCDGGARGNPGPAASAFVVKKDGKIIYEHSEFLGTATNNVAEYHGVIAGLKWINQREINSRTKEVLFLLDSELVTKQLLGIYKTKNGTLKKLFTTAKLLESKVQKKIIYKLIPREKNTDADYLVNEALNNI